MNRAGRNGLAAVGVALIVGLGVATEAQAAKSNTTIVFEDISYGVNETIFSGRVKSPKASCEKPRKVTVFRKLPGKDSKQGSATTGARSMAGGRAWQLDTENYALNGTFYARAKETKKCKGDRSEDFEFNDCMPFPRGGGSCRLPTRPTGATLGLFYNGIEMSRAYNVELQSPEPECLNNRKVFVMQKKSGRDERIAAGRTDDLGERTFVKSPAPSFGRKKFYVRAPSQKIPGIAICKSARSETVQAFE